MSAPAQTLTCTLRVDDGRLLVELPEQVLDWVDLAHVSHFAVAVQQGQLVMRPVADLWSRVEEIVFDEPATPAHHAA